MVDSMRCTSAFRRAAIRSFTSYTSIAVRKRHEAVVAPDILINGEIHGALVAAHLDGICLQLFEGVIAGLLLIAIPS